MEKRLAPLLATVLMALFSAGCSIVSVHTNTSSSPTSLQNSAFAQAQQLALQRQQLSGQALDANTRHIQALLAQLDDATLTRQTTTLSASNPLYPLLESEMLRRRLSLLRPLPPSNDANVAISSGTAPRKLAVLLPLSGPLSTAATPVRDGLLAGYYGEVSQPDIRFYDTATSEADALNAYAQAVADGAQMVIGPLGRSQVDALFGQGNLSVPVLALNRGELSPPRGGTSFSLPPETEGVNAADYLLNLAQQRVLLIDSSDASGHRAAEAFSKRFTEGGGTIADVMIIDDSRTDLYALLAAAAEKNIDAIFFAVRGPTARMLTQQLTLVGLNAKPRVGTSLLIQGTGNPAEDIQLDGIVYPTERWLAGNVDGLPAQVVLAASLPTARGAAARLFAFGYDAWQITIHMHELITGRTQQLQGATGTLTLDSTGTIQRTPAWATFKDGIPVPLSTND